MGPLTSKGHPSDVCAGLLNGQWSDQFDVGKTSSMLLKSNLSNLYYRDPNIKSVIYQGCSKESWIYHLSYVKLGWYAICKKSDWWRQDTGYYLLSKLWFQAGIPNLQDLMPNDLRWSWCNNNRNKMHNKCNVLESPQNHSSLTQLKGKNVFHETSLWCQKGRGPLVKDLTDYSTSLATLERVTGGHLE